MSTKETQLTLKLWYRIQHDREFMKELRRALLEAELDLDEGISWTAVKRQLWPQGKSID